MTARIAVITRTKNRPLLLKRCLRSVFDQSYDDYVHVIVNDGGTPALVEEAIDTTLSDRRKVQVIHHAQSRGIGDAANSGVNASDSERIVLLDDDDTWEPAFLASMSAALDARTTPSVGAVVCRTRIVRESMEGETVTRLGTLEFNPNLREILLFQLAAKNLFSTNAFLYDRAWAAKAGPYRNELPALDDWDFNLRFLLCCDVDVLPQVLANWHWRTGSGAPQTMSAGNNDHKICMNHLRNEWLRRDVRAARAGLGQLVAIATAFEISRLELLSRTRALGPFNRLLQWIRPW